MSRYWTEQIARVKAEDAARAENEKKMADDDEKLKTALAKVEEAEQKAATATANTATGGSRKGRLFEDLSSEDSDHYEEPVKRKKAPSYSRRVVAGTKGRKRKGDDDDYLQWGKELAPLFSGDNCGNMYGVVGKRYKRSLRNALRNMVGDKGSLKTLLTDEERSMLEKNKVHVDKIIQSEDMSVNPFEGDMAPVGKTVMGVLQEIHQGDSSAL